MAVRLTAVGGHSEPEMIIMYVRTFDSLKGNGRIIKKFASFFKLAT